MTDLVFADTETTGLNPDGSEDEIWEFAAVRRRANGFHASLHLYVQHDVEKALRLPEPFLSDYKARYNYTMAVDLETFREAVLPFFARDAAGMRPHLIGAVPDFDTAGFRSALGVKRSESPWHYHIIDVETLMVGWLAGRGLSLSMPWDSDLLSRAVGVDPTRFARHTAMGDVDWTMANYDAVMR